MSPKKRNTIIILLIVAAGILVIGANYFFSEIYSTSLNPIKKVFVKGVLVKAEAVNSKEKIRKGLAGREKLPEGRGMLFMMPGSDVQNFWMQGMLIPIDIIWIENGKVIGCESSVSPQDARIFTSPGPVGYVLEVPAGFCRRNDISANDAVEIQGL